MQVKEINLVCPINQLSYGICSVNILSELQKRVKVNLFPIGQPQAEPQYHEAIKQGLQNAQSYAISAPSLRIFHQFSLAEHVTNNFRIGYPIFELDTFNPIELHHLKQQDTLFVTSEWGKSIIEKNGITRQTFVIPMGVDRTIFHEKLPQHKSDKTIFFHCSKIEVRKGHEFLPSLFDSIKDQDNWELWISWFNHFMKPEEIEQWESYYKGLLGGRVKFLPWVESQHQLANIMAQTDIGIWPSLGEGWLLPALEYMSLGKPVITTNYSAQTEYCNKDNAYLIDCDELEPAYDGRWFFNQGSWMKFGDKQKEQAQNYIKELHTKRQQSGELTNPAGLQTAKEFTWSGTADKILKVLENECFGYRN